MAPPCKFFDVSQLPSEVQIDVNGRRRKFPAEGDASPGSGVKDGKIDLAACELLSMVQYNCQIEQPSVANSPVHCWPVQRWFRRYVVFLLFLFVCFCVLLDTSMLDTKHSI